MINKEMKTKMKKSGVKAMAAVMVASMMMSAATPALAAEGDQNAPVVEIQQEQQEERGAENNENADAEERVIENNENAGGEENGNVNNANEEREELGDVNNANEEHEEHGAENNENAGGEELGDVNNANEEREELGDVNNANEEREELVDVNNANEEREELGDVNNANEEREELGDVNNANEEREELGDVNNGNAGAEQNAPVNPNVENAANNNNNNAGNNFGFEEFSKDDIAEAKNETGKNGGFHLPTEKELAQAKKDAEAAAAAGKRSFLDDKELDRLRVGVSQAGEPLGQELAKAMKGKYKDADDAVRSIGLATIRGINDGIIKNIPYLGGLMHGILAEYMKQDTVVHDKMDDVLDKMDEIADEIKGVRSDLKDISKQETLSKKIGTVNTDLREMDNLFGKHNKQFYAFMDKVTNGERMSATDDKEISYIYSTDRKQIKENNKIEKVSYLDTYFKLADSALNKGVKDQSAYAGNIFSWTDTAWKDGRSSIMEVDGQRADLVDTLEAVFKQGYDVLNTAILIEREKIANTSDMCKKQLEKYNAMLDEAKTDEERDEIDNQINKYQEIKDSCLYRMAQVNTDFEKLTQKKAQLDEMIGDQRSLIQNDRENFAKVKHTESIRCSVNEFKAQELVVEGKTKKGEKTEKIVKVYPTKNGDKIEYKDVYGNLFATQEITTKVDRNPDEIKAGKEYIIRYTGGHWGAEYEKKVKVTKVTEVRNAFASFFRETIFRGKEVTNKTVFFTYEEDGKTVSDSCTISNMQKYKNCCVEIMPGKMVYVNGAKKA